MLKGAVSLFALASLLCAVAQEWNYREDGPATWPRNFPFCDDGRQSPIALHTSWNFLTQFSTGYYKFKFKNYNTPVDAVFTNNGHTLSLALGPLAAAPRVSVRGPLVQGTYILRSLHFHWAAEHTLNGRRYDMEMHMVHSDAATNLTLVLGFLFKACPKSSTGVDRLTALAPRLRHFGDSVNVTAFAPARVMPLDYQCDYFVYSGSLTTPPCTENVTWLVHQHVSCIGYAQLMNLNAVRDEERLPLTNNFRPIQPLNGRPVHRQGCARSPRWIWF